MAKAMGLSLISLQPERCLFAILLYTQCILHGLIRALLCASLLAAKSVDFVVGT